MQFSKNEIKKAIKNQNRLHYIILILYSSCSSFYAKKCSSLINFKSTSPRIICPSGRRCTRSGKRGRAKAKGLKHSIPSSLQNAFREASHFPSKVEKAS